MRIAVGKIPINGIADSKCVFVIVMVSDCLSERLKHITMGQDIVTGQNLLKLVGSFFFKGFI